MGSTTVYQCDNCGDSLPDPGNMFRLEIEVRELKDGDLYYSTGSSDVRAELCNLCADKARHALNRALIMHFGGPSYNGPIR